MADYVSHILHVLRRRPPLSSTPRSFRHSPRKRCYSLRPRRSCVVSLFSISILSSSNRSHLQRNCQRPHRLSSPFPHTWLSPLGIRTSPIRQSRTPDRSCLCHYRIQLPRHRRSPRHLPGRTQSSWSKLTLYLYPVQTFDCASLTPYWSTTSTSASFQSWVRSQSGPSARSRPVCWWASISSTRMISVRCCSFLPVFLSPHLPRLGLTELIAKVWKA